MCFTTSGCCYFYCPIRTAKCKVFSGHVNPRGVGYSAAIGKKSALVRKYFYVTQANISLVSDRYSLKFLVLNLLKPTGYVMHQQFNIQQLYVLPTLYLCVLYLSENKQRLLPLTS